MGVFDRIWGVCVTIIGLLLWTLVWTEAIVTAIVVALVVSPLCFLIGGRHLNQRVLSGIVKYGIWYHMVWMLERWGGARIEFYGDDVPAGESILLISNHIFMADFWMFFALAQRKHMLGAIKMFSKDVVKYVPGFGWGAWLIGFIFIRREWTKAKDVIRNTFANLIAINDPIWLITHPESTRITRRKYEQSVAYQREHPELPALRHLLLPRTRGFVATVQTLREPLLDAVYDLTVDYPEGFPGLWNTAGRRGPRIVVHIRRHAIDTLPEDADGLRQWVLDRWVEKDELIDAFRHNDVFPDQRLAEPYRPLTIGDQ